MGRKGWLSELEKKGLHQSVEILENYGINSETDVSVLDRDDLSSSSARAFFAAECQQWQPVAVDPENDHRRHLSYNSPKNSSFLTV